MAYSKLQRTGLAILACLAIFAAATLTSKTAQAQEGALIGGAVGLGVGAALTRGSAAGVIGGALIGGIIGNEIQKDKRRQQNDNRRYRR